ncbi:MAG TPA: hypothetical protein VMW28_02100 [Pelolinea sp.]|nr:hypothetical protein [Pelolinea sp.]
MIVDPKLTNKLQAMTFQFNIIERIPQATIIHHIDEKGSVWATSDRKIILLKNDQWQEVAQFPRTYPRDIFGFSRPTARAFRSDKCNLYRNHHGHLLGIRDGSVYAIEGGKLRKLFDIQGDCVLHGSLSEDKSGNIYFGEYFMNPERQAVKIWQVDTDLKSWRAAAELEEIRHIHGVYSDPYHSDVFWVTVGDFAGECFILRTDDFFKSFRKFGDGSQIWRAVRVYFTQDYVCWLTDSHIKQNYACRMQRGDGSLEIGQPIDASAWYGCQTKEGFFVAFTTIERGPAIQSDESSVLVSQDGFIWRKISGFRKDFWRPVQIFKYGVISCPSGEMSNESIYLSGEGLVGLDGVSIKACIRLTKV